MGFVHPALMLTLEAFVALVCARVAIRGVEVESCGSKYTAFLAATSFASFIMLIIDITKMTPKFQVSSLMYLGWLIGSVDSCFKDDPLPLRPCFLPHISSHTHLPNYCLG